MNKYKQRAIEVAKSIRIDFKRNIEGKPLSQIDYREVDTLLSKLLMLNVIFTIDIPDDEEASDPLCMITDPLVESLKEISENVRELMKSEFAKAKEALQHE
jgi:hypothetical protein